MENPSPNQQDPDQDQQRNNGNVVEDVTSMTIEFLRARLVAERSVSRTARQRADELAKRVVELEEQLKFVSLQRKKAEKATADVLAILENRGISDFSEEFDSSSDQEINNFESKMGNNFPKEERSVGSKMERNQNDDFSGSEIETSSLPGRSLSWKSGKDSPTSGRTKIIDSFSKKRNPFSSSSFSSPRRGAGGKSCRRIRHRETRSAGEEHTNRNTQAPQENGDAAGAEGCNISSGSAIEIPKNISEKRNLNINFQESVDKDSRQPEALLTSHLDVNNNDRAMERAIDHQTQLVGQYEEEEKAQREWEEKFRENNSSPVSCERGTTTTPSEITEERDETKSDTAPYPDRGNSSIDFEIKSNVENILVTEESSTMVSLSNRENTSGSKPDGHDSMPRELPDKLGPVLDALQQAKLSLNHKIKASPPLNGGSHKKAIEFPVNKPEIPVGSAGLFKVPSDFYLENTKNNSLLAPNSRFSLINDYLDQRNAPNSANQLIISRPSNFTYSDLNINGGVRARFDADVPFPSPYLYNSQNTDMNNVRNSYASPTYPLYTDPTSRRPFGGEQHISSINQNRLILQAPYGEQRPFSNTDMNRFPSPYASIINPRYTDPVVGMPPGGARLFSSAGNEVGRADVSFYNNIRPNMYR